ncbi:DsbA family oxidoreductase [Noviluteimonas gilva]|uniref:DSBA-like thioredoxin domain-containing protein n=1 Tax=Noviluteimonas gilva TaxID=2682097 RepID=A0A7C9LQ66_9GAMM|nr:DsbA family oxidoreductase [Lysobacter gilvus]MUV15243.1 hypothetical protein [Lysobacter gilvus]
MEFQPRRTLQLQVVIDVICPWCYIGKRSLDLARERLAAQGLDVEVEWLPYLLNPSMPLEGMDRKAFRSARFGWDVALEMDARAADAGRRIGAHFDYSLQHRTPNTVAAHALIRSAHIEGGSALQERLVDALFVDYFANGGDIGEDAVLERIATQVGMGRGAVQRSIPYRADIPRRAVAIRDLGLNGVPSYLANGRLLFSGSQDVEGYVRRLLRVADDLVAA